MSCAGLVEGAAYNANEMMAEVERRMMAVAARKVLAVDHNKIGKRALARLCPLADFDVIVTDDGADAAQLAQLRSCGAGRVVVAK